MVKVSPPSITSLIVSLFSGGTEVVDPMLIGKGWSGEGLLWVERIVDTDALGVSVL